MAHLERLQKSFEALKIFSTLGKLPRNADKSFSFIQFLKQETAHLSKNDYIHHCNSIADNLSVPYIRDNEEFFRFLMAAIQVLLIFCDDDDADIRLAASDSIDKICLAIPDLNLNRVQVELVREIERNGSSRSLRAALNKFADLCTFIRPVKFRPFAAKIFLYVSKIIYRNEDDLLQETLQKFIFKVSPILAPYATDKEIMNMLDAYFLNLNCSASMIRRSAALSIVTLCENVRRPHQFFHFVLNNLLNFLVKSNAKQSLAENNEKLFSGIFMVVKFMSPKVMKLLDRSNAITKEMPTEMYEMMFENLIFIYQHLLTSIKYSRSNMVIVSALEALIEYISALPLKIYQRITNFNHKIDDLKSNLNLSLSPTLLSDVICSDSKYESTSSISSSINYIENINFEFNDELFKSSTMSLIDSRSGSKCGSVIGFPSEYGGSEIGDDDVFSAVFFDHENEFDNSISQNKMAEMDDLSGYSSSHYKSPTFTPDCIENSTNEGNMLALTQITIDHFNLGPLYSLEYASKLVCLKFLLTGEKDKLITDDVVRVSIKSLALSCFSSLINIYPEALFLRVSNNLCDKQNSQPLMDILLYANHPDPNMKGCCAVTIGKFFDRILTLPVAYDEFVRPHSLSDIEPLSLSNLFATLCRITQDTSSIAIKQALISFQLFLPKLLQCKEPMHNEIMNLIEILLSLRDNPYWLIKVELINLLSMLPYNCLIYIEQSGSNETTPSRLPSLSKRILEDVVFELVFDNDHRVRQAVLNTIGNYIENLCLNHYFLNSDPIHVNNFVSMLSKFFHQQSSKVLGDVWCDTTSIFSFLDYSSQAASTFSIKMLDDLHHLNVSSNLLFFVKRFFFEISHNYLRKTLFNAINVLSTLAKLYPPSRYPEGWQIELHISNGGAKSSLETIHLLLELLTENQAVMLDMTTHQNLITLVGDLLESVFCCHMKQLKTCSDFRVQSEMQLFAHISPHFGLFLQRYFLHLYKIIVAYSAISEENSAIFVTFIYNMYSKNQSQLATLLKRRAGKISNLKEKEVKKELSEKGSKKQESYAYDPLYHRLFDFLKTYHRNKKVNVEHKNEKYALLSRSLHCLAKLLEIIDHAFVLNYLEEFLLYLKMIFHIDPAATTLTVKQLLKCILNINYVGLMIDELDHHTTSGTESFNHDTEISLLQLQDINSLYSSSLSIPYIKLSDFYKSNLTRFKTNGENGSFVAWLRKRIQSKIVKTFSLNLLPESSATDQNLKRLTGKIEFFEPIVMKSLRYYTSTSDQNFQARFAELLAQLVELHISYYCLFNENVFIKFVLRQFEFLENVANPIPYESLTKRLFYFMVVLANNNYHFDGLIDIPKVIQLCDTLIANGHSSMALDGLYIILDDIFYFKNEQNAELEAQQEVVLAYCFKLLNFYKTFDLLTLIINRYRNYNPIKWTNLSIQIMELFSCKLIEGSIQLDSINSLESLQTLLFGLCPTAFSGTINLMNHFFLRHRLESQPFVEWIAKTLLFFRLALLNQNESDLLNKIANVRNSIEISTTRDSSLLSEEEILCQFLLGTLQTAITEIEDVLWHHKFRSNNLDYLVYLISQYCFSLTFIFQSGFFPKITNAATLLVRSGDDRVVAINGVLFDFAFTNSRFLKAATFFPTFTISWINLLYIINHDHLPEILSKLIGCSTANDSHESTDSSRNIHLQMIKRFSLILFCDYLTENLENVEYLSWLIINHLHEIIDLCYEIPVREFINSIHRKSSSSGLFLQAINSRYTEMLCSPLFASKVLDCLERAHSSQSVALLLFLLEKFLFNQQLLPYYKCCKHAEIVASNRLMLMYELNSKRASSNSEELTRKNILRLADIRNLKRALRNTPYTTLSFTVQSIKSKFFDSKRVSKKEKTIKDPLSKQPTVGPEINKHWFMQLLRLYWSTPQRNTTTVTRFLDKLENDDVILLMDSKQFLIENQQQILIYLNAKICEKQNSTHIVRSPNSNPNRIELARHTLRVCRRLMHFVAHKFPLWSSILERKFISQMDLKYMKGNDKFLNVSQSFLSSFQQLISNLEALETFTNATIISSSNIAVKLVTIYSACLHHPYARTDPFQLIDLLTLIRSALLNRTLFAKLSAPENIHLQMCLIDNVFFVANNYFNIPENFPLPSELTEFGQNTKQFEHIFGGTSKILRMFRSLEESDGVWFGKQTIEQLPLLFQFVLRDIIISLSRLPFVNWLIYVPYTLYNVKTPIYQQFWKEVTLSGEFHTNTPIISSRYLSELNLLQQFAFRISTIGFVNRIQFEEIWMALLGVFSEYLSLIAIARSSEDLNENILFTRCVIKTFTALLHQASRVSSSKLENRSSFKLNQATVDRLEFIMETLNRKNTQLKSDLANYNKSSLDSLYTFHYDPIPIERLAHACAQENKRHHDNNYTGSNESENTVDLYSCLHFLLDLYQQTIQTVANHDLIGFPLLAEIAKSCLFVSDIFTEKEQFHKLLQIVTELQVIVDNFEDSVLNQFVIVAETKTHVVLAMSSGEMFDRRNKLIAEQYFKDFFLPLRIGAVRCVKYLLVGSIHLISDKDLLPILDYVGKHLSNDHCIPSSYCTEYVDQLWSLSVCLIERCGTPTVNDFNEKIHKGLLKNLSGDKILTDFEVTCATLGYFSKLEKTILEIDLLAINAAALRSMRKSVGQLNSIHLLTLYVINSFKNKQKEYKDQKSNIVPQNNDELFMTMEQLSVIFEPLKCNNSLEANTICQVLGHFLVQFFPAQDLLNKCIGEFLSNQQMHYKNLADILFVIFNKFQNDFQHKSTAQDWVILSLSSFTQLTPVSHALWALTCFLISASQNHWVRASFPYFQHRFGQFNESDKRSFFIICNNFFNEIKSDENKNTFIKTFQNAACFAQSPYFDVLTYLCDI